MTAVEKLELSLLGLISFDSEELRAKYKEVIKQAKEMEKQQIIKTYYDGRNDESSSKARHNYDRNSEQYYNETFKNK